MSILAINSKCRKNKHLCELQWLWTRTAEAIQRRDNHQQWKINENAVGAPTLRVNKYNQDTWTQPLPLLCDKRKDWPFVKKYLNCTTQSETSKATLPHTKDRWAKIDRRSVRTLLPNSRLWMLRLRLSKVNVVFFVRPLVPWQMQSLKKLMSWREASHKNLKQNLTCLAIGSTTLLWVQKRARLK